jgi:alanyl-tRNA synthetase
VTEPAAESGGIEIAQQFLRFFEGHGHTIVPSASLVPAGDPTLLFTNAGMVQFKDVFLGIERRSYRRAVTLQRCLRVSGKHNDLETVGPSPWHHTLFFMLGNFSFGDYFKRDAIPYAWEFVTRTLGIAPDRLIATVFAGDEEALGAWRGLAVPTDRILEMGEATNFWSMGDVGPCGPTSELHYDWGPVMCTCRRPDCSVALDNGCRRWLEIWNLVFMQYNQAADGTRTPLPKPGVDTGMGLERVTSVVEGTPTTYDTALFRPIMDRTQALLGHTASQRQDANVSYRVIADHSRATTFLLADGVTPGNEGRAYVLRMIMRRAIRFGRRAGFGGPFLGDVAAAVIDQFAPLLPELRRRRDYILDVVRAEEDRFAQTLAAGLERLAEIIAATQARGGIVVEGADVFRLYDTFGFPLEMTRDVAAEAGLQIDDAGFRDAMEAQRQRSRALGGFSDASSLSGLRDLAATEFVGYVKESCTASVISLVQDGAAVDVVEAGGDAVLVLDRTPFYAESGGQVGDTGVVTARGVTIEVTDTRRVGPGVSGHLIRVTRGRLRVGARVRATVDGPRRAAIRRNHTATHLLHRALHEVLGGHARQAGSLVAPDRLRFDFSHAKAVTGDERARIERRVNEMVLAARPVRASTMSLDQARRLGAVALFSEKYGEQVRVVEVKDVGRELCGGTHLANTGEVGLFVVTAESSTASGIRRIEAVTGWTAYDRAREREHLVSDLADTLKVGPPELPERVRRLTEQVRAMERGQRRQGAVDDHAAAVRASESVADVHVEARRLDGASHDELRAAGDALRSQFGAGVFVLGGVAGERINLVSMVTSDLHGRGVRADAVMRAIAARVGGTGGGKADLAQGGGKDPALLDEALGATPDEVRRLLSV